MYKIVSWNINSVRARISLVLEFLEKIKPDVLLLQETKCLEDQFPRAEILSQGYQSIVSGQKAYNGVAILHKSPVTDVKFRFDGFDLTDARYLEAQIDGLRISNLYVFNGQDLDSDSYRNKVPFVSALCDYAASHIESEQPWILFGDFNIIPRTIDIWNRSLEWEKTGLACPEIRGYWRKLQTQGWLDAGQDAGMTWKGYRYQQRPELRIDHALLSPGAADRLHRVEVLREWRTDREKPSDHMPVLLEMH